MIFYAPEPDDTNPPRVGDQQLEQTGTADIDGQPLYQLRQWDGTEWVLSPDQTAAAPLATVLAILTDHTPHRAHQNQQ